MNTDNLQPKPNFSYRFDIFKCQVNDDGTLNKERLAGVAHMRSGKYSYKVKLFAFLKDRYYLVPDRDKSTNLTIMTRDEVKCSDGSARTYWNPVGSGHVIGALSVIQLEFDFFRAPLFMSIFPREPKNRKESL